MSKRYFQQRDKRRNVKQDLRGKKKKETAKEKELEWLGNMIKKVNPFLDKLRRGDQKSQLIIAAMKDIRDIEPGKII